MNNERLNFLYESIHDTQDIIRAIDVKLHILTAILILPMLGDNGAEIQTVFLKAITNEKWLIAGLFFSIIIFWLLSFTITVSGIYCIDNPKDKLSSPESLSGVFYNSDAFCFSIFDLIYCFRNHNQKYFKELKDDIPSDEDRIISELVFEKMKISYIRDIKLYRQRFAYKFFLLWVILLFFSRFFM